MKRDRSRVKPESSLTDPANPSVFESNFSFFEESSSRFLKNLFADSKFEINDLGGRFVIDIPKTPTGIEFAFQAALEVFNFKIARRIEGKVHFPIIPDLGDVAFNFVCIEKFLKNLILEKKPGVFSVNDGFVTHVGLAKNDGIDFRTTRIFRGIA
jgi:hypothetical protein